MEEVGYIWVIITDYSQIHCSLIRINNVHSPSRKKTPANGLTFVLVHICASRSMWNDLGSQV